MAYAYSNASQKKAQQHVLSQQESLAGNTGSGRLWFSDENTAVKAKFVN